MILLLLTYKHIIYNIQKARDSGEDYERKQFWKYSAESVEAWDEKMKQKAERANNGFTGEN